MFIVKKEAKEVGEVSWSKYCEKVKSGVAKNNELNELEVYDILANYIIFSGISIEDKRRLIEELPSNNYLAEFVSLQLIQFEI